MDNQPFVPDFGTAPQMPQQPQTPPQIIATPPETPAPQPAQPMQSQPMPQETVMDPTQYQAYDFTPNQQLNYNPAAGINSANIVDNNVQMGNIMTEEDQVKSKLKFNRLVLALSFVIVAVLGFTTFYFSSQYSAAKTDVDGQIKKAVALAVNENTTKLEDEFAEKEKYPYKTFAGPSDYGELTFEYPKTWSVYISSDASNGGDFSATLNPGNVTAGEEVYALHVSISGKSTDSVIESYSKAVQKGELINTIYTVNGTNVNVFTGKISKTIQGFVAVIKIRDKTVILQSDAQLFKDEFYHVLDTARFNA